MIRGHGGGPSGHGGVRGRLVDRFTGQLTAATERLLEAWRELIRQTLAKVLRTVDDPAAGGMTRARELVGELVAATIRRELPEPPPPRPIDTSITPSDAGETVLRIHSSDTPLFLYTFSAALALRGVSVQRVDIQTTGGRVRDTFVLVDRRQKPIRDPEVLRQIELTVLLTKRFGYFVGAAPDPSAAALRFE